MEIGGNQYKTGTEIRFPPKRGQIKARIISGLIKKVKTAAGGLGKNREHGASSSSITPSQSTYTSEGNSDA